jgi:hypothetical protein
VNENFDGDIHGLFQGAVLIFARKADENPQKSKNIR